MKKVQFIFGIHNHQPVGNFDHVFQHACDHSYLPFLQVLEQFPKISMAFHFSGSLIEWLEVHRSDLLDLLKKLVQRGNVEILGSGFYEPILAMIPQQDQIGQIRKMNAWSRNRLSYEIKGNWLTERVWEPHLTLSLKRANIDYMVVDDYHFLTSGVDPENLSGYYHTEQEGQLLGVFPINQKLRYAMPFEDPQVTLDILMNYATEAGDNVVVMADDGEKFGIWPGTYDTVYGQKWLERFFTLLEANAEWVTTTTFKQYHASQAPRGLVYLPTSSYFEMSQWTLPMQLGQQMDQLVHDLADQGRGEQSRPFIRGGMWRNFFTKYPESNWMQKRVQQLSLSLDQLREKDGIPVSIQDDLYRAECNCGYWHGVFGGLYLPHLRHAIYEHLLKAESAFIQAGGALPGLVDLDGDGIKEYRLRSDVIQLFLAGDTGQIREMDWLPAHFNITNYLQRYAESYHEKLALASQESSGNGSIHDQVLTKEEGLQEKLFVDNYSRRSFIDHFFNSEQTLNDYYRGTLFDEHIMEHGSVKQAEAGVQITNKVLINNSEITINKQLELHHNKILMTVEVINTGEQQLQISYGVEFNFGLLGGNSPDRYFLLNGQPSGSLNTLAAGEAIASLSLVDEWDNFRINMEFSRDCQLWRAPIETVSMSEAGFERVYQASSLLPHWNLDLSVGDTFKIELIMSIEKIK